MPGGFKWSDRSLKNLKGIHPDLRKVADLALQLTHVDFAVTEGKRTKERQIQLVKQGASKTLDSRHIQGMAIDVVDMGASYGKERMIQISMAFKEAAKLLSIPIVWGGDWKSFKDTPHFELDKKKYPNVKAH
jgi:peptidoglycan L-alanyl-D-glutamate endopeptidase CwlK